MSKPPPSRADEAYSRLCRVINHTGTLCDVDFLYSEIQRLKNGLSKQQGEVQQILGKALGYPRYCDDQVNFPLATEKDGVCVGEHTAETLAEEAAKKIAELMQADDDSQPV